MGDSTTRADRMVDAASRSPEHPEGSAFRFAGREEEESIAGLLRDLVHQGSHLAEQHAELVKAEVRTAIHDVSTAAGEMAGAAVLGIASVGAMLMAASFLLGEVMPLWLATFIVAVVAMAVAYAMYKGGETKLRSNSVTLARTRHTLERAPSAISDNEKDMRHGR